MEKGYVYIIKSLDLYKIGFCIATWKQSDLYKKPLSEARIRHGMETVLRARVSCYRTHNPHGISVEVFGLMEEPKRVEAFLHRKFKGKKVVGEWFRLTEQEVAVAAKIIHQHAI